MTLVTVSGAHLHQQALEDQTPTVSAAPHSKTALRHEAVALRDAIEPGDAAAALAFHLREAVLALRPASIGAYWPIGSEIDVRPAIALFRQAAIGMALPEATAPGTPLRFRRWAEGAVLLPGRFGTWHAPGEAIVPDLLLVPLLAFDRRGHRLGYGGGYYDRTLAAMPGVTAIGCGYAAQEISAMPNTVTDIPLHAIATEYGVIAIRT